MSDSKDIGVIVGRFQVNELHPGHLELINDVTARHKRMIVFLGVAPVLVTRNNPLDFITRKEMLLQNGHFETSELEAHQSTSGTAARLALKKFQ